MMNDRANLAFAIFDRLAPWVLAGFLAYIVGTLALRADRDPPALISPACVTTPSKGAKP